MAENTDQELAGQLRELKEQNQERAKEIAVLEERMKTYYAKTETSIERMNAAFERLRTDMARRDTDMADWKTDMADWKTDMADWKTDMARRENRLLLAVIVVVGVATAILGVLIAGIPAA